MSTESTYNAYTNIFNVDSESRLFLVQEIEDEKYQILFGDGIIRKKPGNDEDITVSYIVTNGRDGNDAQILTLLVYYLSFWNIGR